MKIRERDDPEAYARCTMNMTPMIDVVFQLIVVFLCSMKFKTLDQKMEARLPTDRGGDPCHTNFPDTRPVLTVRLQRAGPGMETRVSLQGTRLGTTADAVAPWARLTSITAGALASDGRLVGEIDAEPLVDHEAVVRALDGFVAAGLTNVRFRGAREPRRRP